MKSNIKEIIFGSGIGDLKFGMTKNEVTVLLGKPDEIENIPGFEEEEVNEELVSWHYDELEISLVFDAHYDWRLVSISGSDEHFTLHGKSIIGLDQDEFEKMLEDLGIEVTNVEDLSDDDNPNFLLLESEDLGLLVWFEEGEAIEFQILPDVHEDEETIIWPEK